MSRKGVCVCCHQEIPDVSLAVSLLHHVAEKGNMLLRTSAQHSGLIQKAILLAAWVQVLALPAAVAMAIFLFWRRRRNWPSEW